MKKNFQLIYALAKNDFREKYLGSYLGLFWAVARPLIFVVVMWFVFSIGLKINKIDGNAPFIIFLLCGYVPWSFFSDSINVGMNSIIGNKFLVKRVDFDSALLPVVKIVSSLYLHLFFLLILVGALLFYGFHPTIYWLQLPIYLFCLIFLLIGVCWLLSALRVFTADVAQFVGAILQVGFWLTPIFWSLEKIPHQYQFLSIFNPLIFVIEGYRNTFIHHVWLWDDQAHLLPFLFYLFFFLVIGRKVFMKLKPHFWDVL